MMASMLGSALTNTHIPIEPSVPLSSPQNPPAGVIRFQIIPGKTVPNSGVMKKLKSAWT
jgi:hypothetical protein